MKRERFTEEQIIAVLRGAWGREEDGRPGPETRDLGGDALQLEGRVLAG